MSASPESAAHKRIAVIAGDGVGREVVPQAVRVLEAAAAVSGRKLSLTEFDWGADRFLRDGTTLPPDAPQMLARDFDAILLGAVGDPRVPSNRHATDILLGLRTRLDLFVNARPCVLFDPGLTPLKGRTERDIRFILFRENTEGLYARIGGFFKKGTPDEIATQEDINTRRGVERIIRYAFEYARARGLRRLCMSDKSNALTFGHDLWQRVFRELRAGYPEIESQHLYIDNLVLQMVRDPGQFDVIVTCNLFGDIASDLGAALIGGLGLAPSGNIHPGRVSLFEPVHGSAPALVGRNVANPIGAILAAAMLCEHIGWLAEARAIEAAVRAALRDGKTTSDLGGSLGTREVGAVIAAGVSKNDK